MLISRSFLYRGFLITRVHCTASHVITALLLWAYLTSAQLLSVVIASIAFAYCISLGCHWLVNILAPACLTFTFVISMCTGESPLRSVFPYKNKQVFTRFFYCRIHCFSRSARCSTSTSAAPDRYNCYCLASTTSAAWQYSSWNILLRAYSERKRKIFLFYFTCSLLVCGPGVGYDEPGAKWIPGLQRAYRTQEQDTKNCKNGIVKWGHWTYEKRTPPRRLMVFEVDRCKGKTDRWY